MAKSKAQTEDEKPLDETTVEEPTDEEEPERLTRTEAANRVIAALDGDETTVTELTHKADALFVAGGGGKGNFDRMYWEVYRSLETAKSLGIVELEEADILVRKVRK